MSPFAQNQTSPRAHSRRRFLFAGATLPLIVLGTAACTSGGGAGRDRDTATTVSGVTEVAVLDNYFEPASLAVPAGATVTWRWQGDAPHNVVGDGFEAPIQDEGELSHTVTTPGTYPYECTVHPGMTGEVIVTAS